DLNPDEYLNGDLKARLRNRSQSREKGRLKAQALSIMRELQKKPEHIRSYFQHEAVQYAR
ncbi:MAG: IS630 family transposase, partial [Phycisphaeraceae bacterium]|nr:IS630 family transposase [Phycisphaeraceae bacterium]